MHRVMSESSSGGQPEQTPVHPSKLWRLLRGGKPGLTQSELGALLCFPSIGHVQAKPMILTLLRLPGAAGPLFCPL